MSVPRSSIPYDQTRDAIAADLEASAPEAPASVARLVGDLHPRIQDFLDRGGTYPEVARLFERRGIEASPDAVRVAMRRRGAKPSLKALLTRAVTKKVKAVSAAPVAVESQDPVQPEPAPVGVPADQAASAKAPTAPASALPEQSVAERAPVINRRLE